MVKTFTRSKEEYKPEQHGAQEPAMVAADATARLNTLKEQRRLVTGAKDILTKGKGSSVAIELGTGLKRPQNELEALLAGVVRQKVLPDVSRNKAGIYRSAADSRQAGEPVFLDATVMQLDMFGYVSSVGELIDEEEAQKRLDERRLKHRNAPKGEDLALDVTVTQFGLEGQQVPQAELPGPGFRFDPSEMVYTVADPLPQAAAA